MQYRVYLTIVMLTVFACHSAAADLEDLKAANAACLKAWNSHDVDAIFAGMHPDAIGFWLTDKSPVVFRGDRKLTKETLHAWFDAREQYSIELIEAEYRLSGDTGIVCGFSRATYKLKGQAAQQGRIARYLVVYSKSRGKWLQVAWHMSRIPE